MEIRSLMYVIGHSAISYLLVKAIFKISDKKMDPNLIIFVIFFSNIIDVFHFGIFRTYSHSVIGLSIIGGTAIFIMLYAKLIKKEDIPILIIATLTHIPLDYFFSSFFFFFPFDNKVYSIFGFNSYEDIFTEVVFGLIFILVYVLGGDYTKEIQYFSELLQKVIMIKKHKIITNSVVFFVVIYVGFIIFTILQFSVFIHLNMQIIMNLEILISFFSLIWILFLFILLRLLFQIRSQKSFNLSKSF